jgi:hypothetical protein
MAKPLVFISCGQYTSKEKQLGADICALVNELRPDVEPYFAEYQSSADGLSAHILNALNRSAGFICIMHNRGTIQTPGGKEIKRGSVWVEQEIAIVAFMKHVLGRQIPTLFFKESGVGREGIRTVLLLNPRVEFNDESEVIAYLRRELPNTVFEAHAAYDLIPDITYRKKEPMRSDRHTYLFVANVKNVGRQKIDDFELRIMFPRAFLNPNVIWASENQQKSTKTHVCLVASAKTHAPNGLYPGDSMNAPFTFDYFIDDSLHEDKAAMAKTIDIELVSGSMTPKRDSLPISSYQDF